MREAIDNGDVRGPRVVASGPQITTTAGHSYHAGAEVDSLDQIRYEVRHHHKMGVDTIKVMATGGFMTGGSAPWFAQFSQGELDVLIAEAHRLGKWTAAHAHGVQGIERAVRAGVDYVAHASFITADGRSEFDPALADEMARAGVYVDCTITADMPQMLRRDDSYAPPARQLWEHGVNIVAGHDAGIPAVPQRGYVAGLEALEWVGLPRTEVILAATRGRPPPSDARASPGCWPRDSRPISIAVGGGPARGSGCAARPHPGGDARTRVRARPARGRARAAGRLPGWTGADRSCRHAGGVAHPR